MIFNISCKKSFDNSTSFLHTSICMCSGIYWVPSHHKCESTQPVLLWAWPIYTKTSCIVLAEGLTHGEDSRGAERDPENLWLGSKFIPWGQKLSYNVLLLQIVIFVGLISQANGEFKFEVKSLLSWVTEILVILFKGCSRRLIDNGVKLVLGWIFGRCSLRSNLDFTEVQPVSAAGGQLAHLQSLALNHWRPI